MNLNFKFGRFTRRTLRSVVRAIGPVEIGIENFEESVIDQLEAQLRRFPSLHRFGLVLGLAFVEWCAPLGAWGILPFSLLSRDQATKRLYLLLESRFKPVSHLVNGLRVLVCLSAYGRTDVEQWFGFERRRWRAQRIRTRARLLSVDPISLQVDRYAYDHTLSEISHFPPSPEALYLSADEAKASLLSWEAHQKVTSPFSVADYLDDDHEGEDQESLHEHI